MEVTEHIIRKNGTGRMRNHCSSLLPSLHLPSLGAIIMCSRQCFFHWDSQDFSDTLQFKLLYIRIYFFSPERLQAW